MHKRNSVFLRVLACFLSFVMMLTMVPFVSLTAAAEDSLPVLGELDEFSTKTSTAIKTLSNMMNAAANASKYSAMLKRAGGYAALLGGSIDALRGAIDAYDKEDPWYENLWNIGSGAVAGFLGLSESKKPATSVQYDLEGMKDLIVDLDKDVQEINTKLDNLEETIQTNFEVLSKKIADKIQETEYKQFLNEFTQTGDRNAFSYYAFFKPDLDLRYRELLVALEGGNAQNIKQAYDNLYMVAKQSEQLYYFVSGDSTILTGKQSIQDILYDYSVLAGAENFELTCVAFAEDVNSTFMFAQYCLSLCYHYQLLYAKMNGKSYDDYYYVQQGDSSTESVQYASISGLVAKLLEKQNVVTQNLAKYMSKVLRLSGEYDYTAKGIRFGSVPYAETFETETCGAEAYQTTAGETVYYRVNNKVQTGDLIQICEMPEEYMAMFHPAGFSISVSNGNAKVLSKGIVQVVGTSGSFDVIYKYDGVECYRSTFQIVRKYSGGMGIEQAPYLISTMSDFEAIRTAEDACHYLLINDIDFKGNNLALKLITSGGFGGVLDGGGYKVYNYKMTTEGVKDNQFNSALFPIVKQNAVIKNLTLGDLNSTACNGYSAMYQYYFTPGGASLSVYNGMLTGINKGIISNCLIQNVAIDSQVQLSGSASNFWTLDAYVGGFAAENQGTIAHCAITNSSLTGRFKSNQAPCRLYIGGIAGINSGKISNCFSMENRILGETTASVYSGSTQSLIYGGNIAGRSGGSYTSCYGENCTITMNPLGSGEKRYTYGIHITSLPTVTANGAMESAYGWKDRGDGKAVLDHDLTKTMRDLELSHKIEYYLGEDLNLTGLELYYSNSITASALGVENKVRAYGFTVSGYDANQVGTQTVTLTRGNASTSFDVTVLCPHEWENGTVTTKPTHTEYGTYTETCAICKETREYATDKVEEHSFTLNANHTCDICKFSKAPGKPVVESKTSQSVTLVPTEGFEYSVDGVTWQSSHVFEDLVPDTAYTFYQRVKESQVAMVSETSVAVAVVTDEEPTFLVIFKNADGAVISENTYYLGDEVVVPPDPEKAADNIYTYTFAGWDQEIVACAGDATYTATYTASYINYTVVFADWDGTVLSSETYHWGDPVTVPANPVRTPDDTYTYTFAGWDKDVVNCDGNATYTATYTRHQEPVARIGDVEFETLEAAVNGAKTDETVVLLKDTALGHLIIRPGVTLDLNGHKLYADYVMGFAGSTVIDSTGNGLLICDLVHLSHDNPQLPVWDDAVEGYRFFEMLDQRRMASQDANGFVFYAKPALGTEANNGLMAKIGTNQLRFKIRMRWSNAGSEVEQLFSVKEETVASTYSQSDQVILLKVSGAGAYAGKLLVDVYLESETGVIWTGRDLTYKGQ